MLSWRAAAFLPVRVFGSISAMRTATLIALVVGLTISLASAAKADDIGYIGVQIKKVKEGFEVTGERCGGARHGDDDGHLRFGDHAGLSIGAGARRIEDDGIEGFQLFGR